MPCRYHGGCALGGASKKRLHVLEVAARREHRPGAGEDDGAHRGVVGDARAGVDELLRRAVAGERVARLGLRSSSA